MPFTDLRPEELVNYRPERDEPADFDAFWAETIAEAQEHPLNVRSVRVETGLTEIVVDDVTFAGFGGQDIRAWLLRPRSASGPLPTVVTYIGYGGGRGFPAEWTQLPSAGYAQLVVDVRGQGSGWRVGDTPDGDAGPHDGGFLTLGVDDPRRYYYRRLFTDAVRAVEAAVGLEPVDASRLVVAGGSQGGAITHAVAALAPALLGIPLLGAIIDVPFLSNVRRATEITASNPYGEIARYLRTRRGEVEQVFATVSYFDGLNFAARSSVPALYSVGLMDDICPPSTVYAAYNHYAGPAEIRVYPYNGHEGGGAHQDEEHRRFIAALLAGER